LQAARARGIGGGCTGRSAGTRGGPQRASEGYRVWICMAIPVCLHDILTELTPPCTPHSACIYCIRGGTQGGVCAYTNIDDISRYREGCDRGGGGSKGKSAGTTGEPH
jgi:hypothetical protein